jgi:hypothetical protein
VAALVIATNHDVISLGLIPDQDLLGTLCTRARVFLAPDGSLGGSNWGGGGGACDHALEALHVNVRLAATVRNLKMLSIDGNEMQLRNN